MIKNVIFDIGNVLLKFIPEQYLNDKYKNEGVTRHLMETLFNSPLWLECDLGHLETSKLCENLSQQYPKYKKYYQCIVDDFDLMLIPIKENMDLLEKLKKRDYKVYLLSDLPQSMYRYYKDSLFFKVDGYVLSSDIGYLKPDHHMYETLLNQYHLNRHECLFIDDKPKNIEGAICCEIKGIIYKSEMNLEIELKKYQIVL